MNEVLWDLSALAHYYRARNKQSVFCGAVRSMSDSAAAAKDLEMVEHMLSAYRSLWDLRTTMNEATYAFSRGGLCANAVMFYARATKPRSGSRGAVDIKPHLPAELESIYNEIHDLRDEGIAHHGSGKRADDDKWGHGALVFHHGNGKFRIGYHGSHMLSETSTIEKLEILVPVSQKIVDDLTMTRGELVTSEVRRLYETNPSFGKRADKTIFDAAKFYDVPADGVRSALDGPTYVERRMGRNPPLSRTEVSSKTSFDRE